MQRPYLATPAVTVPDAAGIVSVGTEVDLSAALADSTVTTAPFAALVSSCEQMCWTPEVRPDEVTLLVESVPRPTA